MSLNFFLINSLALLSHVFAISNPPEQKGMPSFSIHSASAQQALKQSTDYIPTSCHRIDAPDKHTKHIVANGNFETGSLAPWKPIVIYPPLPDYDDWLSLGVTSPGYNSAYAFAVNNTIASSYVEASIGQNVSLCSGKEYSFTAEFYMTDGGLSPQTYVDILMDDTRIVGSNASNAIGPPVVWFSLSTTFTANATRAQLGLRFVATDIMVNKWAIDNVAISPVW
ncbi:MAG: hypothetical protein LQ351_003703 [Letrouitia transgressa]|nr:MAG: hypothetical protein LQ351_003703 [Letrouitia transgressa]